jgi:hypothetical protein
LRTFYEVGLRDTILVAEHLKIISLKKNVDTPASLMVPKKEY